MPVAFLQSSGIFGWFSALEKNCWDLLAMGKIRRIWCVTQTYYFGYGLHFFISSQDHVEQSVGQCAVQTVHYDITRLHHTSCLDTALSSVHSPQIIWISIFYVLSISSIKFPRLFFLLSPSKAPGSWTMSFGLAGMPNCENDCLLFQFQLLANQLMKSCKAVSSPRSCTLMASGHKVTTGPCVLFIDSMLHHLALPELSDSVGGNCDVTNIESYPTADTPTAYIPSEYISTSLRKLIHMQSRLKSHGGMFIKTVGTVPKTKQQY